VRPISPFPCLLLLIQLTSFQDLGICQESATDTVENATVEPELTREERILGLVTIYSAAQQHFAWWEQVPELDWDGAFLEFLPEVEKEEDLYRYYLTLQEFVALLEDGHTEVVCPESLDERVDRLPLVLGFYEGEWVVLARRPVKEVLEEDIPPGTIVVSIDGDSPEDYLEEKIFRYLAAGNAYQKRAYNLSFFDFPRDHEVSFDLKYPDGSVKKRLLRANSSTVEWTDELREKYRSAGCHECSFETEELEGNVHYIWYGSCSFDALDNLAENIANLETESVKGLVLDLRSNGGGSCITSASAAAYFISQPIRNLTRWTRCSISSFDERFDPAEPASEPFRTSSLDSWVGAARLKAKDVLPKGYRPGWLPLSNPPDDFIDSQPVHYDGPMVILTNRYTASAAEDLAVLLRGNNRGPVIGEITAGTTGFSSYFDLPGGGEVRICDLQHHYPDLGEYVGIGVIPDIPVLRTIKAITEDRDETLDAALEYLEGSRSGVVPESSPNSSGILSGLLEVLSAGD